VDSGLELQFILTDKLENRNCWLQFRQVPTAH